MKIFVSGGCKNGKSIYAQKLAEDIAHKGNKKLYYIATMIPRDKEDENRIKRHLKERDGLGFITIEKSIKLSEIFNVKGIDAEGVFLVDSLTALVQNQMFSEDGAVNSDSSQEIINDLMEFAQKASNIVFVSDYIYSDAIRYDQTVEKYRKTLAKVDRQVAKLCDKVCEVSYSNVFNYE